MGSERRLHIAVGPDTYLSVLLRISGDGSWFGETHLEELMALLLQEVPERLPPLLQCRVPTRAAHSVAIDSMTVSLIFQPTVSTMWLVCDGLTAASAMTAVPVTLLVSVEPR